MKQFSRAAVSQHVVYTVAPGLACAPDQGTRLLLALQLSTSNMLILIGISVIFRLFR